MLPNPALKAAYDKVVWLYVYRDFSKNEADKAAELISLRFGVSSWPQHFLADPNSLRMLANTGRKVESFLSAVDRTKVKASRDAEKIVAMQKELEQAAAKLEASGNVKTARRALKSDDIVYRYAGLRVLADKDPKAIVDSAQALLETPHDPFRYAVCEILKKQAHPAAARPLEALVADPKNSLNPNVVRIRAVQALATCGDAESVPVVGKWAATGVYFNGLTGVAIDALVALRKRLPKTRKQVNDILKTAYPKPPADGNARAMQSCVGLARRVHEALGRKRFPKVYDEKARAKLSR